MNLSGMEFHWMQMWEELLVFFAENDSRWYFSTSWHQFVGDWSENQAACTSATDKFSRSWLTISSSYFLNLSTYFFFSFKLVLAYKRSFFKTM